MPNDHIEIATARAIVLHAMRVMDVAQTAIGAVRTFGACLESGVPGDAAQLRQALLASVAAEAAVAGLRADASLILAGLDASAQDGEAPAPDGRFGLVHGMPADSVRMWGMRLADQRCVGVIAAGGGLVAQAKSAAVVVVPCDSPEAALIALEHGRRRLVEAGWSDVDLDTLDATA